MWQHIIIRSLSFKTNKGTEYGPYGVVTGQPFSYSTEGGVIVGFHGRSGTLLDAIGAYVKIPQEKVGQLHYIMFPKVHAGICFIGRLSLCLDKLKFVNLFYYLVYFCYYLWILLHFLVLFMSFTILFQLTLIFIYSIFSKKFLVSTK